VVGQGLDHVIVGIQVADVSLVIGVVNLDKHEAAADAAIARCEPELVAVYFLEAHEPLGTGPGRGLGRLQDRLELNPPLRVAIVEHDVVGVAVDLGLEQRERVAAPRRGQLQVEIELVKEYPLARDAVGRGPAEFSNRHCHGRSSPGTRGSSTFKRIARRPAETYVDCYGACPSGPR